MNAREFVDMWGEKLIGRAVNTDSWGGSYPGGPAIVIAIHPDPKAPEIVMTVEHPTWRHPVEGFSDMGIFEHEELSLAVI